VRLLEIHRFPVKSMRGETPREVALDARGIAGDRAHALLDESTGKIASAKDPRHWAGLLALRAAYAGEPAAGAPIVIERGDGARVRSDAPGFAGWLAREAGREVGLVASNAAPAKAAYDDVWPDIPDLAPAPFIAATKTGQTGDGLAVSTLPVALMAPGTFQDLAPITLMTTASLRAAAKAYPAGRWDTRRFRSNFLIESEGDGFVENAWGGRRLAIGGVVLEVFAPIMRCVMTTLAQQELPADLEILRTLARHNLLDVRGSGKFACLGAYATVVQGGSVAAGATVRLV
jgi:uncharacterized protein YcbX